MDFFKKARKFLGLGTSTVAGAAPWPNVVSSGHALAAMTGNAVDAGGMARIVGGGGDNPLDTLPPPPDHIPPVFFSTLRGGN